MILPQETRASETLSAVALKTDSPLQVRLSGPNFQVNLERRQRLESKPR
jgi:hypothetical protein